MLAVSLVGTVSCEKFLTVEPQDTIMAENYYVSRDAIRANTAVLYSSKIWFDFHSNFMFYAGDMMAGDMYYTYDQEGHYYYNSVTPTNSYLRNGWLGLFRVVSFCNSVINDMPAAARSNGISESVISAAIGEAYTIRAMAYLFLTEYWGEVPIIENATELIISENPDDIYVRRNTQNSLYKFMIRDLEAAIPLLPETDDPGRATKWSAMGLLAKVQLQYAAYSMGTPGTGDAAALYEAAKTNARNAVEGGRASGYGLYGDYPAMFNPAANNCSESLIAIQCQTGNYGEGNARNANFSRSSRIADQTWGAGKGPTISLQELFDNPSDVRRKAIFMTNGDYYDNLATAEGGYRYQYSYRNPDDLDVQVESANEMLAHFKKYVIGKPDDCGGNVGLNQDGGNNLYLLRFADVMMVYIEACIGTGTGTSDGTAIEYMGQILQRAGLTNGYSSVSFMDLIRERRKEFAIEGINWMDVKRVWYRDHQAGLEYLAGMDRDKKYVFNWSSENFTYDTAGNPTYTIEDQYVWENDKAYYTTIWESMDITSENADGTTNQDYYKGAEWLEENGHRVMNISFTDDSMYLPLPEAEVTNAPILREPAVEYDFD